MATTRRAFLGTSLALAIAAKTALASEEKRKLPVAAIVTTYGPDTHADAIVTKILEGYAHDGGAGPDLKLVSLFVDQQHPKDMSRALAEKHGFRIASSIDDALTSGTGRLQVEGVLIIGEHGDYPIDEESGQKKYPRRKFFDEVAATFTRVDQVVPTFSDKHLSYNWPDAEYMYNTARKMKIPLMAGSSLPVTWRVPPLILDRGTEIEDAMAIGYGGLDAYGFHTLEVLQCMVERRRGGEVGVKTIEVVTGDAIWEAEKAGRWSRKLFDAALARAPKFRAGAPEKLLQKDAAFFLIEYRDGLRATVAMAKGVTASWTFAAKLKGQAEPVSTWFAVQEKRPYGHFGLLLKAIEHMFRTGKPAYPLERTLLTTGMLDVAMRAVKQQKTIDASHLKIQYEPTGWPPAAGKPPD